MDYLYRKDDHVLNGCISHCQCHCWWRVGHLNFWNSGQVIKSTAVSFHLVSMLDQCVAVNPVRDSIELAVESLSVYQMHLVQIALERSHWRNCICYRWMCVLNVPLCDRMGSMK